ncbi:MAG: phage baseplate assembly protein V [Hyphomicrobiales bacterium]
MNDYMTTRLDQRAANVVRIGVIVQARYSNPPQARVRFGDGYLSTWLRMAAPRTAPDAAWWPFEIGEEVIALFPGGDLARGVILAALYNGMHHAKASSADMARVDYGNGSYVTHDRASGALTLHATGPVTIEAGGNIAVKAAADITIEAGGNIKISGSRIDLN